MQITQASRLPALLLVFLIATFLAARPMGIGLDDENYRVYFNGINEIISRYERLSYVFNEPLWLIVCYAANAVMGDEGGLRFVIFASSVFAGVGLARLNRWALLPIILYFTLPASLKNHVDHLRQGFALGLYILLFSASGCWRMLRFATPFVHSSFWVVVVSDALLARYYINRPERTRVDAMKIFMIAAIASVVLSFVLAQIAAALGFRQADVYDFLVFEGTGAAFIGWLILLPVLLGLANQQYFGSFAAYLGFYLGGYYFSPVAARIFENSFFLLCSAAPVGSRIKRIIFWLILFGMCIAFGVSGNLYPRLMGISTA